MADYSREDKLNEIAETNLDLIQQVSALKKKSKNDETQSQELMRALTAKRKYESLTEDCSPERFIEHAHEASEALKQAAEKLSPASRNSLMCATFTPRRTKLKTFHIPKTLLPNTIRVSPAEAWHRDNFPAPPHKEQFVIGCANNPKVKDNTIEKENINPINNSQAARCEPVASNDSDNIDPCVAKVNETCKVSIFQTMEHVEPMEDVDVDMLSPGAREARNKR